jgi:nucleotide-binding universal stress UspA family protein
MVVPADAIVQAAEDIDARMIVLGSLRRGGVMTALLGSTASKVLHHTRRPALVVPAAAPQAG